MDHLQLKHAKSFLNQSLFMLSKLQNKCLKYSFSIQLSFVLGHTNESHFVDSVVTRVI